MSVNNILRRCMLLIAGLAMLSGYTLNAHANLRIKHWNLDNGARVFFVESHEIPMVQITAVFDAGAARDTSDKSGLATLTREERLRGMEVRRYNIR